MSESLTYQFYFLLFTDRSKSNRKIHEPDELARSELPLHPTAQDVFGYPQDEDKRIFRFSIQHPTPFTPADLARHCCDCWKAVQAKYEKCSLSESGKVVEFRNASADLLAGVALLVITDELTESHAIRVPHQNGNNVLFRPIKPIDKSFLFNIQDGKKLWPGTATFIPFAPKYEDGKQHGAWQLQFVENQINLTPLHHGIDDDHPTFRVYGLTWGKSAEKSERFAELHDFLLVGLRNNYRGLTPLLYLMTKLLMCDWQFKHIRARASEINKQLVTCNTRYRGQGIEHLKALSIQQLQSDLHEMEKLQAEANYVVAYIQRAVNTLNNNAQGLSEHMLTVQRIVTQAEQQWLLDWHWKLEAKLELLKASFPDFSQQWAEQFVSQRKPALQAEFVYYIAELRNLQIYIEGALLHLEGSRTWWKTVLEERRLVLEEKRLELEETNIELSETLGKLGHVIIFLLALVELAELSHKPHDTFGWLCDLDDSFVIHFIGKLLASPTVYLVVIVGILLYLLGPKLYKKLKRRGKSPGSSGKQVGKQGERV